ncbi:MAG: hypothetical protein K0Q59_2565 [Paenibacillus sp.]|jgi:uncharacterized SAM-binding protein YcdF (DUF218 family)|nr:hypothetical protein [Paenibacillus sp.]
MKSKLRKLAILVAVLTLCGAGWVGYVQWLIHATQDRTTSEHRTAAIVLGAALWNDRPSPGLRERLDTAYQLYAAKQVDHLIVSGGLDANGATITEAEGMKRYLVERGVPDEAIVEERKATSTYENLLYSKAIMDSQGWTKPIIVTHQFHGARAADIARFVGLEDAAVALTDSQVLWMPWHNIRETLAYTKWLATKAKLTLLPEKGALGAARYAPFF